jgi:type VI secretion system protein ImpB
MATAASVAPRERVNITYTHASGNASAEKELPLRLLVVGDFAGRPSDTPIEERRPLDVRKENFDEVMAGVAPTVSAAVPNRLQGKGELDVSLRFRAIGDFAPDAVARQVPELKRLLELREALTALKGPLGNVPAFRKRIQELVADPKAREALLKDLGQEDQP